MLVVDLLHEFELGVWKSILIHLLRILGSLKGSVLAELDRRWDELFAIGDLSWNMVKVSSGAYFWSRYHLAFPQECLRAEEASCSRLWGCTASQCQFIVLFCLTWLMWYSVLFRSLQGCCPILIMCRCCTCCLYSVIGMDSPSYVFTQMTLLKFLRGWRRTLVIVFVAFPWILVLALQPRSYCVKPKLDDDAKGSKIQADLADLKTLRHMPDNDPRGSTFKHTSYMPWQIIHRKSECMVPQIHIQLKLFVPHFHMHIM